ncbi:MAG: AI-2E family transporter [bacterium]|nr:AI-2E family transporter [bacterium]
MIEFLKKNIDYFKKFILAFAVIVVYKTFDNLTSIFHSFGIVLAAAAPFFAALIIAYMLNLPAVKLTSVLKKMNYKYIQKHAYGISITVIYILAAVILGITLSAVVPALYQNLLDFSAALPDYLTRAFNSLSQIELVQKLHLADSMPGIDKMMSSFLSVMDINSLGGYVGQVFSVTSGVINAFIAVIASIYMLLDKHNIINRMKRLVKMLFKTEIADSIIVHASSINTIFTKYIYCRLICSVICGTVCGIVLSIMRVKYALILAIFIGAMDMIPYFGSIISCIIAIVITFITGGFWLALWTAVALLIIQQLDGNLLAPKLMGNSLELSPLLIIIVVFVGGKLFGFVGMLLSVPIIAVLRAILSDYLEEFAQKRAAVMKKAGKYREEQE